MSDDFANYASDRLTSSVSNMATALRNLADDIENVKLTQGPVGGTDRHTYYVQTVQHKLVWGLANLGTEYLPSTAAQADAAELDAALSGN